MSSGRSRDCFTRAGRRSVNLVFCDVFELQGGRIRRLVSYLMETK
jgi:hypothetical protein